MQHPASGDKQRNSGARGFPSLNLSRHVALRRLNADADVRCNDDASDATGGCRGATCRSARRCAPCARCDGYAFRSRGGGVLCNVGRLVSSATELVSPAGHDPGPARSRTPVRGVHEPVPVGVDPGRGGGVHVRAGLGGEFADGIDRAEGEAFTSEIVSGASPRAASTARAYQLTLRLFCKFVTNARYGWPVEREQRFGRVPGQIRHEWNTVAHRADYEGRPGRRALIYDEVQALGQIQQERGSPDSGRSWSCGSRRDGALFHPHPYSLRRLRSSAKYGSCSRLVEFAKKTRIPTS